MEFFTFVNICNMTEKNIIIIIINYEPEFLYFLQDYDYIIRIHVVITAIEHQSHDLASILTFSLCYNIINQTCKAACIFQK